MSGEGIDRATERRRVLRAVAHGSAADGDDRDDSDGTPPAVGPTDTPDVEDADRVRSASPDGGRERALGSTLDPDDAHSSVVAVPVEWECAACGRGFQREPDDCPGCGGSVVDRVDRR